MNGEEYFGREQTLVKHTILDRYLLRFALIVGRRWNVITYVDCFSGPWSVKSPDLSDASFAIALSELRKARERLAQEGRQVGIRCFFLEADPLAHERLRAFASAVRDAEVKTCNARLEHSTNEIVKFVRDAPGGFPFIFIDPTGWTGFGMNVIAPLLRLNPGEVLINFMTHRIRQFIDSPLEQTRQQFEELFGTGDVKDRIAGLAGLDREEALVSSYASAVQKTGRYQYVCAGVVLHPEKETSHYHLIYATRNPKGVDVFKDAERTAMTVQEKARADAWARRQALQKGTQLLFPSDAVHESTHYETLRDRHLRFAEGRLREELASRRRIGYDTAWMLVAQHPLVWESDLKEWIRDWLKRGDLQAVENLKPRQRVPKMGQGHILVWQERSSRMDEVPR